MQTHILHIIFPPVYGTGGPSRIWGITSPPNDGHQSPKQAIGPGAQDHADVSAGGHSSSCCEAHEALVLFTKAGLTLVPLMTQNSNQVHSPQNTLEHTKSHSDKNGNPKSEW